MTAHAPKYAITDHAWHMTDPTRSDATCCGAPAGAHDPAAPRGRACARCGLPFAAPGDRCPTCRRLAEAEARAADPYVVRPGRPLAAVAAEMAAAHQATAYDRGCDPDQDWRACEVFTLARLRGLCHSLYLVQLPDWRFALIDWADEGPAAACGAEVGEPYDRYSEALREAARQITDEAAENEGPEEATYCGGCGLTHTGRRCA